MLVTAAFALFVQTATPAAQDTHQASQLKSATLIHPAGALVEVGIDHVRTTPGDHDTATVLRGGTSPDDDWNNFGGTPRRDGQSSVAGPLDPNMLLWSNTDDYSIIAWHPVTLGRRVFAIREYGFPSASDPGDELIAWDLDTGVELWRTVVPYTNDSDDWIAWVGGARDGRVYCGRGGSGRTSPVYAFDANDGGLLWDSAFESAANPQNGLVFAPNGDPIVGDLDFVTRIDASDGSTVWSTPRDCAVSGNCGAIVANGAVYIDTVVPGGQAITKVDLASGAILYDGPTMPGFTAQNAPFAAPDGTLYFARSQNNAATDFLYAYADTGAALVEKWNRPIRWTTSHEHGIGLAGEIYTFLPGDELVALDPNDGSVRWTAGTLNVVGTSLSPRTAVDRDGNVYVSNGWASSPPERGRIWGYTPDLSTRFLTLRLDRQNSGGPSLGADGTLVVADRSGVYAYRSEGAACPGDVNGDLVVDLSDLAVVLGNFGQSGAGIPGDADGNGMVDLSDLAIVLANFGAIC